jgi:hypothetical protein
MLHDAAVFHAELVSWNLKLKYHQLRYSPKNTIENSNALLANDHILSHCKANAARQNTPQPDAA